MASTKASYCTHCGSPQSRVAGYCHNCGRPIAAAPANTNAIAPEPMPIGSAPTFAAGVPSVPTDATFARRLAAGSIDVILAGMALLAALGTMGGVLTWLQGGTISPRADAIGSVSTELIVPWLYFAIQEASKAQATIGKRALGVRVETLSGERLSFARATGRWLAKWLSLLTFGVGFLMVTWTRRHQALHDLIAGTLVRRQPQPPPHGSR